MATHTVGEVSDALLLVLLVDLALVVLMATEAGIRRITVGMAGRAGPASAAMVHREAVWAVEGGRAPGDGRVAQRAVQPE